MPANLEGVNVLVVDDDQDILTTVRLAFEQNGAKVATGNDGNKAVEMATRLKPDLIIVDMMMPKKSGFLVIETIKPNSAPGTKPYIIMITANEGKRHELYARSLGVDDYVNKPFATERLIEVAARLFQRDYKEPERW
ncbi:MAG: response regulator [Planctomycetes bacterium]|nr:response regulator [Planctomycetota bacterium]